MTAIDRETVEKLAKLTRIEMGEEEKGFVVSDLESILGYVSELSKVREGAILSKVEPSPVDENRNCFRDDDNAEPAGLYTDKMLAEAPRTEDGYILVKQVIGEKSPRRRPAEEAGVV